jgi:Polyketide cyclase / dehydrase and lipid transport
VNGRANLCIERTVRVVGAASPEQVWERYAVPARWAEWAPHIRRVDTSARRIAPGVRGRVHGLLGLRLSFVVGEVDEQRRTWSWEVRLGLLRMHLRHGVEPHPRGTATWLALAGPAPAVVGYGPVARLALRSLVR